MTRRALCAHQRRRGNARGALPRAVRTRVRPYYLLQADPVRGTSHLRTPIATGLAIMEAAARTADGESRSRSTSVDTPGGKEKWRCWPDWVVRRGGRRHYLRTFRGEIVDYVDPRRGKREPNAMAGRPDLAELTWPCPVVLSRSTSPRRQLSKLIARACAGEESSNRAWKTPVVRLVRLTPRVRRAIRGLARPIHVGKASFEPLSKTSSSAGVLSAVGFSTRCPSRSTTASVQASCPPSPRPVRSMLIGPGARRAHAPRQQRGLVRVYGISRICSAADAATW